MTFQDIFKSSYLDSVTSFSLVDTLLALFIAFAIGLMISLVYRKTFRGVMYSPGFAATLIGMSMVTTLVILAVTSNVVLSLGMVGALSIVRFRSAIKNPLDIVFLFWSMVTGIVVGAGFFPMAILGAVLIGAVLILFVNRRPKYDPYLLVLSCENDESEQNALAALDRKYIVKSKTVSPDGVEVTAELRLTDMTTSFINRIAAQPGVRSAVLVSYNGDYLS